MSSASQWRSLILVSMIAMVGCGSPSRTVTQSTWQQSLEQFAAEENSGDLSLLRAVDGNSSHRQFTVLGSASSESTDVAGVFLGRRAFHDDTWLVFLVGSMKNGDLTDARLALLADGAYPRRWLQSRPDAVALGTYRTFRENQWRAADANRKVGAKVKLGFPAEDDAFSLETLGNTISVVETRSTARWTLVLDKVALDKANQANAAQLR